MNEQESEDYKVVIIGAGNGGLVATARLALSGIKVLLIEQHNFSRQRVQNALERLRKLDSSKVQVSLDDFF